MLPVLVRLLNAESRVMRVRMRVCRVSQFDWGFVSLQYSVAGNTLFTTPYTTRTSVLQFYLTVTRFIWSACEDAVELLLSAKSPGKRIKGKAQYCPYVARYKHPGLESQRCRQMQRGCRKSRRSLVPFALVDVGCEMWCLITSLYVRDYALPKFLTGSA